MSGGRLVVLDRAGRDIKRFPLAEGLATLGRDPACDICIMLPMVSPHHATVVVHANQTVVRNVCGGETLVNGQRVSVAALRHGDLISIGGRHLRWDYSDPTVRRPQAPEPALYVSRRKGRGPRRGSGPPGATARDPAVKLALEMSHRSSMPGNAGGKQVAIVQPQRRETSDQIDRNPPRTPPSASKRARAARSAPNNTEAHAQAQAEAHTQAQTQAHAAQAKRKSSARNGSNTAVSALQNTTKATLWIESRKTSPRKSNKIQTPTQEQVVRVRRNTASAKKSTPLRLTVLKRAQSAQKSKVTKIEAPLKLDHTKQAAILLMTGHTPKAKLSSPNTSKRTPSFVVKQSSPVRRRTPRSRSSRATATTATTASAADTSAADRTVTILEITDSDGRNSSLRSNTALRRSGQRSPKKSPALPSPRKSALKDPLAKRGTRKTESIKFDLSNLESHSQDTDILMVTDTTKQSYETDSASDDDITLRYSESSGVQSPSPRRSIHSRSSKMLEKTLGTTVNASPPSRTLTPESPRRRRSLRGSMMLQKALNQTESASYSRRTTKSVSDSSQNASVASAYRTRTLSPRTPQNELESYSIVDLVSIDTDESARTTSVYESAGSNDTTGFGTTFNSTGRKTRSTIDPSTLLGSSTPYVKATRSSRSSTSRSRSSPNISSNVSVNGSQSSDRSSRTRRSKSLSTPENTEDAKKLISVNSTRISRASRSRSRINDSDLLLLDDDEDSPRTSKRISTSSKSTRSSVHVAGHTPTSATPINSPAVNEGTSTPENRHSPEEASTPVLSIQSLLDSSQSSLVSQRLTRRGRPSYNTKRKTIGVVTGPKTRVGIKSKSMSFSARKTRLRLSSDSVEVLNNTHDGQQHDSEIVTPKSAVKLVQEGVKNKHSTAKKTQSKRSMIDDLNESDIVKQLFNSPVKRKLSQSMTEFSRKQLFDDDDAVQIKRPTRNTIAITGRTPDNSLLDNTESYTPERFVSPISTPTNSPNLAGIKLMYAQTTPENDLRNVTGVKGLLRTPRTRRSIKNDLTNVSGVKTIFAKSPKNRLSDVRVKEVFAKSPKNDLRRVTGVKSLFQTNKKRKSPRNELEDVRGVKKLFNTRSPVNDLRNVSGVKRILRKNSPKNDLSDLRGVKRMFRREKRNDLNDVSGIEELFNVSNQSHKDAESLFDRLIGKPQIRAVYSRTFSKKTKTVNKIKERKGKSLHASLDLITNNVEEWLEQELNKRLQKANEEASTSESANKSKSYKTRELEKLATDTVEGNAPIVTSRIRNSTIIRTNESDLDHKKSASELYSARKLPIKKRSLVEKSIDKGNDSSANNLPIKKRMVLHSTPVKGRVDVTMNASVLGRVSPIAAVDATRDDGRDASVGSPQKPEQQIQVGPKSRRGTRAKTEKIETRGTSVFVKPSPKNLRAKTVATAPPDGKPASPDKKKVVVHAKAQKSSPVKTNVASPVSKPTKVVSPDKSKRVSPVKGKKSSLAKATKATPAKTKRLSPAASPVLAKSTRSRRKDVSPTELNTTKREPTVVIAKKSPIMSPKPRATRKRKDPETSTTPKQSPKKARATRKNYEAKEDKPKTPKTTRAKVQKATVVISKPSPQLKPRAVKPKGKSESVSETTRKTRRTVVIEEKVESPKKSQVQRKYANKTKATAAQNAPKTRGQKPKVGTEVENIELKTKNGRQTVDIPVGKKTRNNRLDKSVEAPKADEPSTKIKMKQTKSVEEPKVVGKRTRKVKSQESIQAEPSTRARRAAKPETIKPEVKTRKRKSTEPDNVIPPKVSKSEIGRKRTTVTKAGADNVPKVTVVKENKVTRGKKVAEVEPVKAKEPEQRTTRGRKANIENVPANQELGKRKRTTAPAPSPVKEGRKKQRGASAAAHAAAIQTTGRSRRR